VAEEQPRSHNPPDTLIPAGTFVRLNLKNGLMPSDSAWIPLYRASTVRYTPQEWRDAGKASPPGTHDWSHSPSIMENWARELEANAGLDISQVPKSLSTVAWFWQCDNGHRWREPTNGVTANRLSWSYRSGAPRWKTFAGKWGACRQCVFDAYGLRYEKCGHVDRDLTKLSNPPRVEPGWCSSCRDAPVEVLGAAVRVSHDPPTSKEEGALRSNLAKSLPLARREEANCVVVPTTSWGARHVFPDMLIPVRRVAIEYDSPGMDGEAHSPDSQDAEKDAALRAVGWEVIRVRVRLPLMGPYDVAATGPTHKAAAEVIAHYSRILTDRGRRRAQEAEPS
jgi:hypothetical protein